MEPRLFIYSLYLEKTEVYRVQIQACRNFSKYIRLNETHKSYTQRFLNCKLQLNLQTPLTFLWGCFWSHKHNQSCNMKSRIGNN